jgi:hypothetical protein
MVVRAAPMNRISDGPATGYGSVGVFIDANGVVEVVKNRDGSYVTVVNTSLCAFVRATGGRFVQGERNWIGFVGTSRDTCNGYMVLT